MNIKQNDKFVYRTELKRPQPDCVVYNERARCFYKIKASDCMRTGQAIKRLCDVS